MDFGEKLDKILKAPQKYSEKEVRMTIRLIPEMSNNSLVSVGSEMSLNEQKIEYLSKILENNDSEDIIRSTVYALGDIDDPMSVKTVANYIDKINDNGRIRYYANKNYLTIEEMLDNSKDDEDILQALQIVRIAPYKEFKQRLEEIANKSSDDLIVKEAKNVLKIIDRESISRNKKWDEE